MGVQGFARMALALCAPLFLFGCIITPGKFTSTLSINADRSFAFTYQGEVIALDMGDEVTKGMSTPSDGDAPAGTESSEYSDGEPMFIPVAWQPAAWADDVKKLPNEETERKNRAIAEALSKEAGYKSVKYMGEGKFVVDYAISGTLNHSFVYPYNLDAEVIFPFIALELRANGAVRVKAPAFGNEKKSGEKSMGMGDDDKTAKLRDGTFTLTTDAEIISQNNEDGAQTVNGRKTIVWKVTPLSQAAPTAVLKMKP